MREQSTNAQTASARQLNRQLRELKEKQIGREKGSVHDEECRIAIVKKIQIGRTT